MDSGLLQSIPITVVYFSVVLIMLISCEVGYFLGKNVRTSQAKEDPISVGPMVGGLLGMLAFVLAFTFSIASNQHDMRKQNVLDEANAIGTAYLRSDLIEPEYATTVKNLLREYVDVRLHAAGGGDLDTALASSTNIHHLLWSQVASAAAKAPDTNTSLMVQSVNEVIDMHEKRLTAALRNRIPNSIWLALSVISILSMVTMGIQVGLAGKREFIAVVPLALSFAALIVLVVDLDRPQKGLITIGQQAMINLQSNMKIDID